MQEWRRGARLTTLGGDGHAILLVQPTKDWPKALADDMGAGDDKQGPLGGWLSGGLE